MLSLVDKIKLTEKEYKTFKCPICGCEKHYYVEFVGPETDFYPITMRTRDVEGDLSEKENDFDVHFETYICKECGHIEMFAEDRLMKVLQETEDTVEQADTELKKEIKQLEKEIVKLKKEVEQLFQQKDGCIDQEELDRLNNKVSELEEYINGLENKKHETESDLYEVENKRSH